MPPRFFQPKPNIISRSEWGGGLSKASGINKPSQIIIHHTGDPNDNIAKHFPNNDKAFMLREYEIAIRGVFKDFPYNFAIGLNNTILQGRDPSKKGAHEPLVNSNSLSIAVLGNYDIRDFNKHQEKNLIDLLSYLCYKYDINPLAIYGHYDLKPTACPGKNVYRRLPYVRGQVARNLNPHILTE